MKELPFDDPQRHHCHLLIRTAQAREIRPPMCLPGPEQAIVAILGVGLRVRLPLQLPQRLRPKALGDLQHLLHVVPGRVVVHDAYPERELA